MEEMQGQSKDKRDPSLYESLQRQSYKLLVPIDFGGERYTTLTFREPIADDLWNIPGDGKDTIGDLLTIGAKLANVPVGVMRRLRAQDTFVVKTLLFGFFLGGAETGEMN